MPDVVVGALGFGDIGARVAEMCAAVGAKVWACRRRHGTGLHGGAVWEPSQDALPPYVARGFGVGDGFREFLEGCDYVVNLLPSTPETRGLLSAARLRHCKDGAVLINVGRGDVFGSKDGEKEIMEALDAPGGLRHAVLDVFAPEEPLPKDSFLWRHPKVTITPHNAARSFPEDVARAFAANLERFRDEKPLQHKLDWNRGY